MKQGENLKVVEVHKTSNTITHNINSEFIGMGIVSLKDHDILVAALRRKLIDILQAIKVNLTPVFVGTVSSQNCPPVKEFIVKTSQLCNIFRDKDLFMTVIINVVLVNMGLNVIVPMDEVNVFIANKDIQSNLYIIHIWL